MSNEIEQINWTCLESNRDAIQLNPDTVVKLWDNIKNDANQLEKIDWTTLESNRDDVKLEKINWTHIESNRDAIQLNPDTVVKLWDNIKNDAIQLDTTNWAEIARKP